MDQFIDSVLSSGCLLLVKISNSCVSGVANKNIYLLSFVALALIMLRAAYLLYKYFFLHFRFFKKAVPHRNGFWAYRFLEVNDWIV